MGLNHGRSRFLAAVFSTPHTTSVPIILMQVVGPVLDMIIPNKLSTIGTAQQRGFLYIVMNSIFSNIWRWSGAYYLIEPEEDSPKDDEALALKDPLDENKPPVVKKAVQPFTFGLFLKKIINAPLITSIFSLGITCFPTFQSYFTTPGSPLNETLISVNNMVSKSYSFICIYMLGLSFADSIKFGKDDNAVSKNIFSGCDLFWLSIMKLIVMPLLACPLILLIFRNWLGADDVLVFIYLFMASAPSAINIIVICAYKEAYVDSVSMLMVVIYAVAVFTMTLQVTFFIYLLGVLNPPIV